MSTALTVSLILLVFVIMGAIIATTVYFVKLLIELTLLTKNLDETTTIVKGELEELKETMTNVNNLAKNADNQVATIRKIFATVIGFFTMFAGKFKFLQSSFFKGFISSFNLFRRK